MKLITSIVLAACLAMTLPVAEAAGQDEVPHAPLPDATAAEADLRGLISGLQSGRVDDVRLSDQLAGLVQAVLPGQLPILSSFGPPGAIRLGSRAGRTYTFVATHPVGEVEWMLMYAPDGDLIADVNWNLLVPPSLQAELTHWHGLAFLPGHSWKMWMLDLPAEHQLVDACWWVEVAVRMECKRVFRNGVTRRLVYTLQDDRVVVVGAAQGETPLTYAWDEDGSSRVVRPNADADLASVVRTYYSPQMFTRDVQWVDSTSRYVVIREGLPGHAERVLAQEVAAHEAAKVAMERERMAKLVEELGTFGPDPTMQDLPEQRHDVLGAFMRGLSEGMEDNAQLEDILNRGNGVYDDAPDYGRGYEDVSGDTSSGASAGAGQGGIQSSIPGAPVAAAKPLRFVLMIGMETLPGDTHNPTCYSNVITRPGPPGWGAPGFLPSGSAEQAQREIDALKDAFIAACQRTSGRAITGERNFTHIRNEDTGAEARMQAAGPRFAEDVAVVLN